jgi:hypothetical protein
VRARGEAVQEQQDGRAGRPGLAVEDADVADLEVPMMDAWKHASS